MSSNGNGKMNCFVTGTTGFIGYNLLLELLDQKEFSGIFCLYRSEKSTLFPKLKEYEDREEMVKLKQGDITNLESLLKACPDRCDVCFHVAGDISMWKKNNERQKKVNVQGTANIVKMCVEKGVKKLVHVGSDAVYAVPPDWDHGTMEVYTINEKSEMFGNVGFHYEQTKHAGYLEVMKGVEEQNIDAVILHPAAVIGEHDENGYIRFFDEVFADELVGIPPGEFSWVDVKELAKALISSFKTKTKPGESFVIGGEYASCLKLCQIISRKLSKEKEPQKTMPIWLMKTVAGVTTFWSDLSGFVTRSYNEPVLTWELVSEMTLKKKLDSTKAIRELGFVETPLEEIIERVIKFREEKWKKKDDKS